MKFRLFPLLLLAGMFVFSSCEDDLLDINEDFYYTSEIQVFTTDTAMMVVEVVDMTDQSTIIDEYKDKIKDIEITDVKYWLTAHDGSDMQEILESTLKVAAEDGSGEELIASIQDQVLAEIVGEDNAVELPLSQAGIDRMASLIKEEPFTFQLIYNTACNEGPLNFTVKFQFRIKMTANPL
jgi:hypothetical protein